MLYNIIKDCIIISYSYLNTIILTLQQYSIDITIMIYHIDMMLYRIMKDCRKMRQRMPKMSYSTIALYILYDNVLLYNTMVLYDVVIRK